MKGAASQQGLTPAPVLMQ